MVCFTSELYNVNTIYSSLKAFAALKNDGTVVTWGQENFGGNSTSVSSNLTYVSSIASTQSAFAALANIDTDGDGLYDVEEIYTHLSNPNLADSDNDGLSDADEVLLNSISFDVNEDNSAILASVMQRLGLLTIDEVKDLRSGSTLIEITGNQATLSLNLEESSDLASWTETDDVATISISANTGIKFFRFKMAE